MSDWLNKQWVLNRMAFLWFVLISFSSLATCIVASLQNAQWDMLNGQAKFLLVLVVFMNWSTAMGALITNTAKKIESGKMPFDDGNTSQFKQQTQNETNITVSKP